MVEHIKQLAQTILASTQDSRPRPTVRNHQLPLPRELFNELRQELSRLQTLDFAPAARHDFLVIRACMQHLADMRNADEDEMARLASTVASLLESYLQPGSGAVTRSFANVNDANVRRIVERDYRELQLRAFPDGAWKSTVILAGSILEAVLYDRLTKDAATVAAAMASSQAPKRNATTVKDITRSGRRDEWTLSDMIKVAADLAFISPDNEKAVDQVLREFRNFVHPRVEVQKGVAITEGHATAAKGMLEVILDELT